MSAWIALDDNQREWLEARAAILKCDAGLPGRVGEVWCWGVAAGSPEPDRPSYGSPNPDD
jgi:hypothetical protein